MGPAHDDTKLHLVTVREQEIVLCAMPHPVQTKGIAIVSFQMCLDCLTFFPPVGNIPLPGAGKNREGFRENVVIDQTSVHREDTHHQHDVSTVKCHGEKLVADLLELLIPVDHGDSSTDHEEAVSEITEHDSEEEWEGNDGG